MLISVDAEWFEENTFNPSFSFGGSWRGWCLVSGKIVTSEAKDLADAMDQLRKAAMAAMVSTTESKGLQRVATPDPLPEGVPDWVKDATCFVGTLPKMKKHER